MSAHVRSRIQIPMGALTELCRRYHVRELSLFGSVLRDDFRDNSDVDVLVEFEPKARIGLFETNGLQCDLEAIFKRRVDLVTTGALREDMRDGILASSRVIWPEWKIDRLLPSVPFQRERVQLRVLLEETDEIVEMSLAMIGPLCSATICSVARSWSRCSASVPSRTDFLNPSGWRTLKNIGPPG